MSHSKEEDDNDTKKCKRSSENEEGDDRISYLPDNLLVSILSLLPIHSAAATSALSRRWRYLWTHITHFYLIPCEQPHYNEFENVDNFTTTVDHILSQLNSPKITSFTLDLPFRIAPSPSSVLVPWINQICGRSPTVIQIFGSGGLFQIPTTLFQTQSLVNVYLDILSQCKITIPQGTDLAINLPNLKLLHLCLSFTDSNDSHFMSTLIKSCPLLQDLHLQLLLTNDYHHQEVGAAVEISAPNLTRLYLTVRDKNYHGFVKNHKFVIDAPLLEYCYLGGYLVFYDFVKSPTPLIQVTFSLRDFLDDDDNDNDDIDHYRRKILQLFPWICCTQTLILTNCDVPLLCLLSELDNVAAPLAFPKLTILKIQRDYDDCRDWQLIPLLPRCLLANLKRLELTHLMGTHPEIKMLQHILSNAPVLKHLDIFVTSYSHSSDSVKDQLGKEYEFCRKLFKSSSSHSCEINFSGVAITASAKDFCDDVLTCQIIPHRQLFHNTDSD